MKLSESVGVISLLDSFIAQKYPDKIAIVTHPEDDADLYWDLENVPCLIGLRQQGKFDTVTKMLAEGKTWKEIGKAIGWCPVAAEKWYERER